MPMLLAWKHCLVLQQTHHPMTTPGSPLASIVPFSVQDAATGKLQQNEMKRAVQLRKTLADLGPAFIKVGQALSARPDLLPQTYLEVCTFATSVVLCSGGSEWQGRPCCRLKPTRGSALGLLCLGTVVRFEKVHGLRKLYQTLTCCPSPTWRCAPVLTQTRLLSLPFLQGLRSASCRTLCHDVICTGMLTRRGMHH